MWTGIKVCKCLLIPTLFLFSLPHQSFKSVSCFSRMSRNTESAINILKEHKLVLKGRIIIGQLKMLNIFLFILNRNALICGVLSRICKFSACLEIFQEPDFLLFITCYQVILTLCNVMKSQIQLITMDVIQLENYGTTIPTTKFIW